MTSWPGAKVLIQDEAGNWRPLDAQPFNLPKKQHPIPVELDGDSYITLLKLWAESLGR